MHVYVKETELYNFSKILPNDPKYKLWMILQFNKKKTKIVIKEMRFWLMLFINLPPNTFFIIFIPGRICVENS